MLKKLTPKRCPCNALMCYKVGFEEGCFYQGCGFDELTAVEIARRFELYPELVAVVDALWKCIHYGHEIVIEESLHKRMCAIRRKCHSRVRPIVPPK